MNAFLTVMVFASFAAMAHAARTNQDQPSARQFAVVTLAPVIYTINGLINLGLSARRIAYIAMLKLAK